MGYPIQEMIYAATKRERERIAELEAALASIMRDVDYMVERDVIPDIRGDFLYVEARRVLPNYETVR